MAGARARARETRALLAAILAAAFVSVAESGEQRDDRGPRMEIQPEVHDFGSTRQDRELVHPFVVLNTGTEDLVIRRIATSCGCTAAVTEELVVPPGGTTTLEVTLETRKYRGMIERSISVAANDRRRVHTVRVRAFVEPPD